MDGSVPRSGDLGPRPTTRRVARTRLTRHPAPPLDLPSRQRRRVTSLRRRTASLHGCTSVARIRESRPAGTQLARHLHPAFLVYPSPVTVLSNCFEASTEFLPLCLLPCRGAIKSLTPVSRTLLSPALGREQRPPFDDSETSGSHRQPASQCHKLDRLTSHVPLHHVKIVDQFAEQQPTTRPAQHQVAS